MSTSLFPSLIDELVDDLIRNHLLSPDEALSLNCDTKVRELPGPLSSTLHNHHWKHEARDDQPTT